MGERERQATPMLAAMGAHDAEVEIVEVDGQRLAIIASSSDATRTILTEGEAAILRGIRRGLSNASIAAERGTSANTVANQVSALMRKLGASSRYELVAKVPGDER